MLFHINMFVFLDYHRTEDLFSGDITISDSNNTPTFNLNGGQPSLTGSSRRYGIYFRTCYMNELVSGYVGSRQPDHVTSVIMVLLTNLQTRLLFLVENGQEILIVGYFAVMT